MKLDLKIKSLIQATSNRLGYEILSLSVARKQRQRITELEEKLERSDAHPSGEGRTASTTEANAVFWSAYDWSQRGDEWSVGWGGTPYMWSGTILPRITAFLPAENILEIAPGYGRCTQYLYPLCKKLIIVDVAEKCIEACQERFREVSNIEYFVNDGKSLDMVKDDSLDFVFSWDSMVHAENDVMYAYLKALSKKMRAGAYGFIHHSNFGEFVNQETGEVKIKNLHGRTTSMTATLFQKYCDEVDLLCISQELVNWGCNDLTDSFSLFANKPKKTNFRTTVWENRDFMKEAEGIKSISRLYSLEN